MPLKIKGSTNGSVTLAAPDTGSDVTLSLPGVNSELLPVAGGKILQIVRATDSTNRSTTSNSLSDVTGMSVTITPQINTSAIIVLATGYWQIGFTTGVTNQRGEYAITDSSNNILSGGNVSVGATSLTFTSPATIDGRLELLGYSTPATQNATTYKLRFRALPASGVTNALLNSTTTGQMYAIEVSA
jgi:hypothetical protein